MRGRHSGKFSHHKFSRIEVKCNFREFYFRDVKIFICVLLRFKSFASISRLFQIRSMLFAEFHAPFLRESVTACCFPDFSAHLSKFSQLKFRESVQFANIVKILPRENFPLYGIMLDRQRTDKIV